ncbi:TPA: site-specific recombinase [Neisseria weaveri]|uniref:site-specific recombinase n=1 Tax=Neisseria weaveri TaxID=28091 RepID=UPI0007C9C053|nr:recombinase [Neisseria weaveri]SAY51158.1 site-specific recombinase [Neisseria weaveri]
MIKITPQNLHSTLTTHLESTNFVSILDALAQFLRKGGERRAPERFNQLINILKRDEALCRVFSTRFYLWLSKVHVYPALVGLGIFSRSGFSREIGIRIYERFLPSFKDFNNLKDVFLHIFRSKHDEKWLQTISMRQWLTLHQLLSTRAESQSTETASRQIFQARLHALEMLSVWIAAEELEPDLVKIEPRLLQVDSDFVALQRETAKLVEFYQHNPNTGKHYDTAHIEVILEQCRAQVEYIRRKGTGVGAGSSVKVAHLLERLSQTLDRLDILLEIQTASNSAIAHRKTIELLKSITLAAIEQHSTHLLRRQSIKMLAKSISENTSDHGEHYITRNKSEYLGMLWSAVGGGALIALMALNKIHIGNMGFGPFWTSLLSGFNYGFGFMLIHMLHFTVATKQPAMTAARFAEQVEQNEKGRAVEIKLAKLMIDVVRSQSVAVFGNVSVAILLSALIAYGFAAYAQQPLLAADNVAYQLKSMDAVTQPTLWYAAIAGLWLFCSGIISGFFDNRANYLDLRRRLAIHPLFKKFLPPVFRLRVADYFHRHYGSLAGNFIFGMLLGLTGYFGHLLGLPLDIRHVAFSSANLGYAAVSGDIGFFMFLFSLFGVFMIGLVNLVVSFSLALTVALRSRDSRIDSIPKLISSIWQQAKANPLSLFFPVQTQNAAKNGKNDSK